MNLELKINEMEVANLSHSIFTEEWNKKRFQDGTVLDIEGELISCSLVQTHWSSYIVFWDFVDRNKHNPTDRLAFVLKCVENRYKVK